MLNLITPNSGQLSKNLVLIDLLCMSDNGYPEQIQQACWINQVDLQYIKIRANSQTGRISVNDR